MEESLESLARKHVVSKANLKEEIDNYHNFQRLCGEIIHLNEKT